MALEDMIIETADKNSELPDGAPPVEVTRPNVRTPRLEGLELSWRYPSGLLSLSVVNFFLRLATLGIYDFWGRTEVRKRIWGGIRVNGEPLAYHGTGGELFKGFMIIFFVLLLPVLVGLTALALLFPQTDPAYRPMWAVINLILTFGTLFLIGVGTFRAMRYRLSRTTWRGIRMGLDGQSGKYGWTYLWTLLLAGPTLGWIMPWRAKTLQGQMTRGMRFGSQSFSFDAGSGALYKAYAVLWLFGAVSLFLLSGLVSAAGLMARNAQIEGQPLDPQVQLIVSISVFGVLLIGYLLYLIASAWYRARMFNHFARHTQADSLAFEGHVSGRGFIAVAIGNFFIRLAFALGGAVFGFLLALAAGVSMAVAQTSIEPTATGQLSALFVLVSAVLFFFIPTPIVQARNTGYMVSNLKMVGGLDLEQIAQGAAYESRAGEGLAHAFDIDAF